MKRLLFCQLGPAAYRLSVWKCRQLRRLSDRHTHASFAHSFSEESLPVLICGQKSLIRRKLGRVDPVLQDNKAVNLALAAPKVTGILIKPGETFSFWRLVGPCREKDGYRKGLVIANGQTGEGIGGGLCQFTNLIHWLVLHSPLEITEHHHHDGLDLFPDFGRQIPFGTGTSIFYNYLDYRFYNPTDQTFQLITYSDGTYLCAQLRAQQPLPVKYHIRTEGEGFIRENGTVFRTGSIYQDQVDVRTGSLLCHRLIKVNHARVLYDIDPAQVSDI